MVARQRDVPQQSLVLREGVGRGPDQLDPAQSGGCADVPAPGGRDEAVQVLDLVQQQRARRTAHDRIRNFCPVVRRDDQRFRYPRQQPASDDDHESCWLPARVDGSCGQPSRQAQPDRSRRSPRSARGRSVADRAAVGATRASRRPRPFLGSRRAPKYDRLHVADHASRTARPHPHLLRGGAGPPARPDLPLLS